MLFLMASISTGYKNMPDFFEAFCLSLWTEINLFVCLGFRDITVTILFSFYLAGNHPYGQGHGRLIDVHIQFLGGYCRGVARKFSGGG